MFRKSDILKTVVCLALIIVLFSAPAGAEAVSDFESLKKAVNVDGAQTIYVSDNIDMQYLSIPNGADIEIKPIGKSVVLSFESLKDGDLCIKINSGGNLTLIGDNEYTLTIKGVGTSGKYIQLISNDGKLTLEPGVVITSHVTTKNYGGLKNTGLIVMNGGEISYISGTVGGAVSMMGADASFVMNGGTIKENTAETGAGIYLSEGSVSINGGSVSQNDGYDIEVVGRNPLTSSISISGDAVISSIHFQNGNLVPVIKADSDFSGNVNKISYDEYISGTKTVQFQSPETAQNLQNKFHLADEEYCLVPSGKFLIIESSPDIRFALNKPTEVIIPKYQIKIPVSLDTSNKRVSSITTKASVSDENGNKVSGLSYFYTVKDGIDFAVNNHEENTLTLSTGTDITQSIEDLFTLTISNTDSLQTGKTYTVTLSIESSVSNTEDYTTYPTQTLTTSVQVVPLILAETANTNEADIFSTPVWSFKQKAAVTYIISPFEASLEKTWPAVSRHTSPSYSNIASELTKVTVYKSETPYDSKNTWIQASSTVSKNQDGTIHFALSDNDKDAKCFKIVFSGRKLGDVVEGTGDTDNVNLYDVDMILHAAVSPTLYIKPEWRLYADTDSDGKIMLADAMNAFNFFKGYTA